jgi:hypothetical protein
MSPQPDDLPAAPHDVPGFGALGESAEDHELRRIRALNSQIDSAQGLGTARPPVITRDRAMTVADQQRRLEITEALTPLVGEAFGQLSRFLSDLQQDIRAQSELMATLNVPMEAVVDSHERASVSFETLRSDISEIARETPTALRDLARVMDTAGLNDAQSRAERRFEELAISIERRLIAMTTVHENAFKGLALDMTKILHLLERLQARELRDAKRRVGSAVDGRVDPA